MLNGGPLAIEWEKEHVPAIVEAFFPGEMGGDAIVSVLYGDVAPTGRLPVTVCATFPFFFPSYFLFPLLTCAAQTSV
jgi:hypothetical protein